jgi:hypothetical protein
MDTEKRRAELLKEIKRKDHRTEHFVKDKQDTVKLVRLSISVFSYRSVLLFCSRERWPNHLRIRANT